MAKTTKRFSGVRRDQRVRIDARRDDTRTFRQRLRDTTSTAGGTVAVFGFLTIAALIFSWAPFVPELFFLLGLSIFLGNYRFKKKKWSIPLRVPQYISKKMRMSVADATTGKKGAGNIFLGRCEETGEEVWGDTGDLNKHTLMIGTTGSGKTEAIMGGFFGFVALNSGGLIVDGKASVTTFGSAYKIARVFGREADLLTMDYLTGGIDVAGLQKERRSHTYNPLGFGGPSQKSETMVSLLDEGDPMWSGRAITFFENVIPPLSYLSDRGYIVLNPKLLGVFSVLEVVENLITFGVFRDQHGKLICLTKESEFLADWSEIKERSGGIVTYLEGLPGYSTGRPPIPHRTPDMTEDEWRMIERSFEPVGPEIDPNSRTEVLKQHGYIQMQTTRAITNLAENYGFIYGAERGEIDYRDMVLNRRLMVVLLPALERSAENLNQLGKMTTLSLKAVLGSMLNTASEGKRREIIDGNPSASKIPFFAVLDEVGYYMSKGLAVVPAQARSLGVAMCFGTQSIPDLMKADENEGKSILDNTAMKWFGRLTSDEKSDTARTAIDMGGQVHVQVADQASFEKGLGGLEGQIKVGKSSGLQTHSQISYDDLARQENGEFHIIVGTRDTDERGHSTGGSRVVRALAFYTGLIPDIEDWRRNPFCAVPPPSKADIKRFREAEIAARQMRDGLRPVFEKPSERLRMKVHDFESETYLGKFLTMRREAAAVGDWPEGREERAAAIREWMQRMIDADVRRAEAERLRAFSSAWNDEVRENIVSVGLPDSAADVVEEIAAAWHAEAIQDYDDDESLSPETFSQPASARSVLQAVDEIAESVAAKAAAE